MSEFGGLLLEALRLDRWPVGLVRERAGAALELGVGGFILFGGETEIIADLTRELRRTAGRPLWMAADLERGAGQQVRGATELPPPAALASHPERERAVRLAGSWTGREARALGVNWVLAPVLDLDIEARNPIVGTRSFGSDPELVTRLGRIWIRACQAEGVAACAKHFPGHGRTATDSHAGLPVVSDPRPVLERDLEPFRAVAAEVATVMTAHVAYPALGADGPATLSPFVLAGLLRGEFGFKGITASDAMIMQGFRGADPEGGPPAEGRLAARAIAAGCDLLLYPRDLVGTRRGIAEAAERDPAFAARAREALARSQRGQVRWQAGVQSERPEPRAGGHPERVLELAVSCVVGRESPTEAGLLRSRPTRLLRFVAGDRRPGAEAPSEAGAGPDRETSTVGEPLADELRRLGWVVSAPQPLGADPGMPTNADEAGEGPAPDRQTLVVLETTPRAWQEGTRLPESVIRSLRVLPGPKWVVVLGHPRTLAELGLPGCAAWAAEAVMQRAAARWLDARLR